MTYRTPDLMLIGAAKGIVLGANSDVFCDIKDNLPRECNDRTLSRDNPDCIPPA